MLKTNPSMALSFATVSAGLTGLILYTSLFHCGTSMTIDKPATGPVLASYHPKGLPRPSDHKQQTNELELVVASTKSEDTAWLHEHLPHWQKSIYAMDGDDVATPLTLPQNKGHEAMVYLTYIIDRYDSLPDSVLFIHGSRFAWHNDNPDYDGLPTLRNFRLSHLQEAGYVNMRCAWVIGCPAEIRPALDSLEDTAGAGELKKRSKRSMPSSSSLMTKHVYRTAFEELLPGMNVPDVVAVGCCAQFGVTRDTIRQRPRENYIRFREWLLSTPLEDSLSGGVFEYSWHIIFGKSPVHCPTAQDCYCKVYGICDTTCDEGSCKGRYTLPPYSTPPSLLVGRTKIDSMGVGPV